MSLLQYVTATPKTIRVLAEDTGWTRREVELEINRLRLDGVPLVTDGDGVRFAQTADEARLCATRLRQRAIHQLLTSRALRRAAQRMAAREQEQGSLWAA